MQIKKDIEHLSLSDTYHKYVLGQHVWYLDEYLNLPNPSETYDEIKKMISDKLGIHFNNIAIAGSAKTGISLSPRKDFKEFDANSDLDIILVSEKHFQQIWQAYIDMYYKQFPIDEYDEVKKSIFKRFISLKDPTLKHATIKNWVKDVDSFVKDFQTIYGVTHEVNYRIYESWEAVQDYHYYGIKQLQSRIKNQQKSNQKILSLLQGIIKKKNGNVSSQ